MEDTALPLRICLYAIDPHLSRFVMHSHRGMPALALLWLALGRQTNDSKHDSRVPLGPSNTKFPRELSFHHYVQSVSGSQCNIPMKNIPFKPLSERMLEEPFWLGLITVTIVLILIGICYLLKKHLPEKLEKFIGDDIETGKLVEKSLQHQGAPILSNFGQTSTNISFLCF